MEEMETWMIDLDRIWNRKLRKMKIRNWKWKRWKHEDPLWEAYFFVFAAGLFPLPAVFTGSVLLPWTSPAQAFPLGRANNSEETAVIKTPTKRRHYCNRSENSNSKNTQNFVWLILGCITSGTIFLWSIHHFVLLANDDFCNRFIIWFSDTFVNEGMREKCRHSLTARKSEKDAVTRSDRPADLHTQRISRESSDSTSDSASDSASWWSSALLDSEV